MKICLAIAFASSFLFGYLYTKLKSKERYKPELKAYKSDIKERESEINSIIKQNENTESKLKLKQNDLSKINNFIANSKDETRHFEENKNRYKEQIITMKDLHIKKGIILKDYNKEIVATKSTLGLDDISKIQEHKKKLKSKVESIKKEHHEVSSTFTKLLDKKEELTDTNKNLKSSITSLTAKLSQNRLELTDAKNKFDSIASKLQSEFETLVKSKDEHLSKIQEYKEKLFSIRKRFS
jgi:chromosome segregation ATPase